MTEKSVYEVLSQIDVSEHIQRKGKLSYLSWAWAWGILKKNFPQAQAIVYENPEGLNYFSDGKTAWVKTGISINGLEHIEYLPVMDYKNKSIPLENLTSFDVNTAIQRSMTKAIARHGLGLYIYAGEDLPELDRSPEASKELIFLVQTKKKDVRRSDWFKVIEGKAGMSLEKFTDEQILATSQKLKEIMQRENAQ